MPSIFFTLFSQNLATTMGYNVDVQRNKNREFLQSIEAWVAIYHPFYQHFFDIFFLFSFFEIVAERFIKVWTHIDFIYRFTDLHEKQQKQLFNLHTLSRHVSWILFDFRQSVFGFVVFLYFFFGFSCFFLFRRFLPQFFPPKWSFLHVYGRKTCLQHSS